MESENPRVIRRQSGGWLAVSPRECSLKIGLRGDTEKAAIAAFNKAFLEWKANLEVATASWQPSQQ